VASAGEKAEGSEGRLDYGSDGRITGKSYGRELLRLQEDLVDLQKWIKREGLRVAVIFEGRDAAGKGGVITRITQRLSNRIVRVVALGIPTEREQSQWYFQRYVSHLPASGEMVLFDRSWYNRAGVERVMVCCTYDEYEGFLRSCPGFERMLVQSGIILIKYWFAISAEEQERRFKSRLEDPRKRWKIGPIDIASRAHWFDYSRARDEMLKHTDTDEAPWYVVGADVKRHARLNCITTFCGRFRARRSRTSPSSFRTSRRTRATGGRQSTVCVGSLRSTGRERRTRRPRILLRGF